jgi:hypothetical protein
MRHGHSSLKPRDNGKRHISKYSTEPRDGGEVPRLSKYAAKLARRNEVVEVEETTATDTPPAQETASKPGAKKHSLLTYAFTGASMLPFMRRKQIPTRVFFPSEPADSRSKLCAVSAVHKGNCWNVSRHVQHMDGKWDIIDTTKTPDITEDHMMRLLAGWSFVAYQHDKGKHVPDILPGAQPVLPPASTFQHS